MKAFFWVITIIACLIAGIQLFDTFMFADSAPQQAAGAAMAVAIVVIPYVFARAFKEIWGSRNDEQLDEIIELLKEGRHDNSIEAKARMYDESQRH